MVQKRKKKHIFLGGFPIDELDLDGDEKGAAGPDDQLLVARPDPPRSGDQLPVARPLVAGGRQLVDKPKNKIKKNLM